MLFLSWRGYSWVSWALAPGALAAMRCSAWSLCCQQKNAAAPVSSSSSSLTTDATASTPPLCEVSLASIARLHGRPDLVMPLHVVAGFRESERGMRDSGVRPVNIANRVFCCRGGRTVKL